MEKDTLLNNKGVILAGIASASLLTGCGGNKDVNRWATAPGTKGYINLEAVKKAFTKTQDVKEFEKRVNEIFEGDNLVVFDIRQQTGGFVLSAREDLNNNKQYDSKDDLLFTLSASRGRATLKGAGVNSYYNETWSYNRDSYYSSGRRHHYHRHTPYFFYWGSPGWTHRHYYSTSTYGRSIYSHRSSYRSSPAFATQVKSNVQSENTMSKKYGDKFRKSINKPSTTRKSYIGKAVKSSSFKKNLASKKANSGWGTRAKSSTKSSFSKSSTSPVRVSSRSSFGGGFRGSSGFGV